jgi:hypothetical protein
VGYLIKAIVGLGLFLGSIAVFNVELVKLLETGTCASGNQPFEIARPCPEGTETAGLLLTASIFAGLIGALLVAVRGDPPWGKRRRSAGGMFGFPTAAWGLFFTVTGAWALIAARTSDVVGPDGELGGTIVGITFLVMGAPALILVAWNLIQGLGERDERPAMSDAGAGASVGGMGQMLSGLRGAQSQGFGSGLRWGSSGGGTGAVGPSGGDSIAKLERLQRLRESGALSDAEFEREKAKILAE